MGDWLDRGDLAAMRLFGAQVAAALDAARIIADLSRRNAELAALNRLGELAGEAADLPRFFARAAEVVRDRDRVRRPRVYVLDEPAGELVRRFARRRRGLPEDVARLPLSSRPSATSCATGPRGWCAGRPDDAAGALVRGSASPRAPGSRSSPARARSAR